MAIHGNKSQGARTRALAEFKDGTLRVLVATDIAARGIDITELPHVVNYELPNVPEDYVHRIGRTGRAGAEGEAVSLVCVDELEFLADIERVIKRQLPRETVPGFAYDASVRAEPIVLGRRQVLGQRGGRRPSGPPAAAGRAPTGGPARSGQGHGQGGRPSQQPARGAQPGGTPAQGRGEPAPQRAAQGQGRPAQGQRQGVQGQGRGASGQGRASQPGQGRSGQPGQARAADGHGQRRGAQEPGRNPAASSASQSSRAQPAPQPAASAAATPASRGMLSSLASLFKR
jgi:ATP-dependent RNA helicase RhlE